MRVEEIYLGRTAILLYQTEFSSSEHNIMLPSYPLILKLRVILLLRETFWVVTSGGVLLAASG